jgi:predicted membrane-bound dolichyl-phosphate-mannose-protein mannosyltransferase
MYLIYLASPHSHEDYMVMQNRYEKARDAVAILQRENIMVLSPICHSHPPQMVNKDIKANYESYREFDEKLIYVSDELWVLIIEGWNHSYGIMHEVRYADSLNKVIKVVRINYSSRSLISIEDFKHYKEFLRKE